MLCSAGVVPMSDYQELAQKLIDNSFPSESVGRRALRVDPESFWELLASIGMKKGQQSCLARYLDRPPAAAADSGGVAAAASADPEAAALCNLKSLCAAAGVAPTDHEAIARRLIQLGVADEISLRDSLCCSPPAFDLKTAVVQRFQAITIMDYLEKTP